MSEFIERVLEKIDAVRLEQKEDLSAMRAEQKGDMTSLTRKVDTAITKLHDHETRITVVEGTRKTLRWALGALAVAVVTAGADAACNHYATSTNAASAAQEIHR